MLEGFVAFDEIAIRAFGGLCPVGVAKCVDHWKDLTPAQRTEVVDLLAKLVVKNYRKNHIKGTNEYVTTFVGTTTLPTGELKVKTETKSKTNTREPASTLDYIVKKIAVGNRVIDIVAEGSSMTRNYNDQFHKMLTNPAQGYSHVVKKLKERLAE